MNSCRLSPNGVSFINSNSAGEVVAYNVCGAVFQDADPSDNQGYIPASVDLGLSNLSVSISCTNAEGTFSETIQTESDGQYCFEDLPEASCTVCTLPPSGSFNASYDVDGAGDHCSQLVLGGTTNPPPQDFGYAPEPADVCGTIFNDDDSSDGLAFQSGSDTPIGSTAVTLSCVDSGGAAVSVSPSSVNSAVDGSFCFQELPLDLNCQVCATNPGALWNPSYDANGVSSANCSTLTTVSGSNPPQDFGYAPEPADVCGTTYEVKNGMIALDHMIRAFTQR